MNEHSPLDLGATLKRMEPGVSVPGVSVPGVSVPGIEQSLASIAISLKRIADLQEYSMHNANEEMKRTVFDAANIISSSISNHSSRVIIAK